MIAFLSSDVLSLRSIAALFINFRLNYFLNIICIKRVHKGNFFKQAVTVIVFLFDKIEFHKEKMLPHFLTFFIIFNYGLRSKNVVRKFS